MKGGGGKREREREAQKRLTGSGGGEVLKRELQKDSRELCDPLVV